jgi:acyl carrier protein
MQDGGSDLPRDRLIRLVQAILAKNAAAGPVSAEDELAQIGLTSLDMVSLMLGTEAEFDVMIPAAEITPANFRSISTIETMISAILSARGRP